jgi:uncharacterized OsmC-like protein
VEKEGNVLVVRRISVNYRLKLQPDQKETAERVHGFHADHCPMYRSVKAAIDVTTSLEFEFS